MSGSSLVMGLVINIGVAAVILIVGLWLAKRLKNFLSEIMVKRGVDPMLASFTGSIVHIAAPRATPREPCVRQVPPRT